MASIGIEVSTQMGDVEALMDLLDEHGELRGDVAAEMAKMIRLMQNRPKSVAETVCATSHRVDDIGVTVWLKGKRVGP